MPEYDNRNRFVLFKNNRKREGKRDPDWTGTYWDDDGKEHWLSGWVNETNNEKKEKFLSGPVKPKDQQGGSARPQAKAQSSGLNDEMPF